MPPPSHLQEAPAQSSSSFHPIQSTIAFHSAIPAAGTASTPTMALGVLVTMAFLLLLFSLVALSHCDALQADSATNASSSYRVVVPAKVQAAVEDAEGLLRLPSSVAEPDPDRSPVEPVAEPDPDRSPVQPVAEPDPDRSKLDSDELATKKPCSEGQQGHEKVKEQIDDEEEEKEKANRKREGKKKTKKRHDGDDKGNAKEKAKKHHRQSDDEDKEEENTKKRIHRHRHTEDEPVKKNSKLSHHIKNSDNGDDDEDEEKMAKLWRKKPIKKRFVGHGRRSQREEA